MNIDDDETLARKFPPLTDFEREGFEALVGIIGLMAQEPEGHPMQLGLCRAHMLGQPVAVMVLGREAEGTGVELTPVAVLVTGDLFDHIEPMPGGEITRGPGGGD